MSRLPNPCARIRSGRSAQNKSDAPTSATPMPNAREGWNDSCRASAAIANVNTGIRHMTRPALTAVERFRPSR